MKMNLGLARALLVIAFSVSCASTSSVDESRSASSGGMSFDGLVPVESDRAAIAYIEPEADFSVFERVMILDPFVSFRANWQRDQNRRRSRRIRTSDMERIKADVAALFKQVFTERLTANDGFQIADAPDYDVLIIRPAIIDLDVTAPSAGSTGRNRSYAVAAGAATLVIELYDSVSGDILGRAIDRRAARRATGVFSWMNGVTNRQFARREFGVWADRLREFLEEEYVK